MSVVKSKRGVSSMQYVETARKLKLHAFEVCTKAPKRYGPYLLYRLFDKCAGVFDEVNAANNIIPKTQHEAQMRREHLIRANGFLQNIPDDVSLLYDSILKNPEKCPWIDHAVQTFGELIADEAKLIAGTKKSDKERYRDLPGEIPANLSSQGEDSIS